MMSYKRVAYVAVTTTDGFGLGIAEEHTKGYYPLGTDYGVFATYDDAAKGLTISTNGWAWRWKKPLK